MRRQAEQLQKWVEAKGCLIDPDDPGLSSDVPPPRGAEHEVIYREGWKHVLKITHPGTYGSVQTPRGLQRTATPYFYLRRIILTNEVFHSEIKLVGITRGENPSIIISQPYAHPDDMENPIPSDEEIRAFMTSLEFESIDGTSLNWIRKADGIRVSDAKPDNFIKTQGKLTPIDLIVGFDEFEPN